MAKKIILLDTSILIDYFRKSNKENTILLKLVLQNYSFAVSTITKYEIFSGINKEQFSFWKEIFEAIDVLSLDEASVDIAVQINNDLKKKSKQIDIADLFIAATALRNKLTIATLNKKHFERIVTLNLLTEFN